MSLHDQYMHGDCDIFALAVHEETGWPLVAEIDQDGNYTHVLLQHPSGKLFDYSGLRDQMSDEKLSAYHGEQRGYRAIDWEWLLHRLPMQQKNDLAERKEAALEVFRNL